MNNICLSRAIRVSCLCGEYFVKTHLRVAHEKRCKFAHAVPCRLFLLPLEMESLLAGYITNMKEDFKFRFSKCNNLIHTV